MSRVGGREMSGPGQGPLAFGCLLEAMQDGHQVDVSEGELLANEMTGFLDRLVEHFDLCAYCRHDGIDCGPVGLSVGGARRDVGEEVGADQRAVDHGVDERYP